MDKQGRINRDVNAAQRVAKALELRTQERLTYEAIAAQCGYSHASGAHKAIKRELDRRVVTNVDELRQTELHTLDQMQAKCWKIFADEKAKGRLFACDRILAIMERRAKLLGLDTLPEKANTMAAAQVVIREVPAGYFGESAVEAGG